MEKKSAGSSDKSESKSSISSVKLIDDLLLGPLDKYEKYGKFPWKLLVHIIMLFLVTIEVSCTLVADIEYSSAFTTQLYQQFLTTDPASYMPPENNPHVELFNIDELRDFVNRTVSNYYFISRDVNLDYL